MKWWILKSNKWYLICPTWFRYLESTTDYLGEIHLRHDGRYNYFIDHYYIYQGEYIFEDKTKSRIQGTTNTFANAVNIIESHHRNIFLQFEEFINASGKSSLESC